MSTDPTIATVLETVESTLATEPAVDIESIKQIMDGFDPAALLPELESIFEILVTTCRVAVMAGPIVLLVMGLLYLFLSPREANYIFGYRCFYGMGSVEAWRYSQRLAGLVLGGLGLVLTVVSLLVSGGFAAMEPEAMAWRTLYWVIAEVVLALLAILTINGLTAMKFTAKGELRKRK
jgi:hypothetical protein